MSFSQSISDNFFKHFHQNNLVYNTCWEDPRCDKSLMELKEDSSVVMITSAGCNALSYALDNPAKIHCIDVNHRQNALLQLKTALLEGLDFSDFFQLFGGGSHKEHLSIYYDVARSKIDQYSQHFWDKNIGYFNQDSMRKSFYFNGTSGMVAWVLSTQLKLRKRLYRQIQQLFESENIDDQQEIYQEIEGSVFNRIVQFIMNRHLTMCLLGVPKSQQKLFVERYQQGAFGFIKERMRHVFTQLPLADNYFYRVYFHGNYSETCCPEYLKEQNFNILKSKTDKINTYNTTVSQFLKDNPGEYSHFVMLDHQDWLAQNRLNDFEEEWNLIIDNSARGARILLRTASDSIDFIPSFVHDHVDFNCIDTTQAHFDDRVGTYAGVHIGVIK